MAKKDDMLLWGLGGLVLVILGYGYLTSQKAGAPVQGIAVGEPNPSTPKKPCGCGMEPADKSMGTGDVGSATPSTS